MKKTLFTLALLSGLLFSGSAFAQASGQGDGPAQDEAPSEFVLAANDSGFQVTSGSGTEADPYVIAPADGSASIYFHGWYYDDSDPRPHPWQTGTGILIYWHY